MSTYKTQRQRVAVLRQIGTWATVWWAVSCAYPLFLVWQARNFYEAATRTSLHEWGSAIGAAFSTFAWLQWLLVIILAGWIGGGWFWLYELKRHKVNRAEALKDLFLTVRK